MKRIFHTVLASAALALAHGIHASDGQEPKKPVCPLIWIGSDEMEGNGNFFSARLKLEVTGTEGVFHVEAWRCHGARATTPEDCRELIVHSKALVRGRVSITGQKVHFAGESVTEEIFWPEGMATGKYCLDTLDGTIEGSLFKAVHSDPCNPSTRVILKRVDCT